MTNHNVFFSVLSIEGSVSLVTPNQQGWPVTTRSIGRVQHITDDDRGDFGEDYEGRCSGILSRMFMCACERGTPVCTPCRAHDLGRGKRSSLRDAMSHLYSYDFLYSKMLGIRASGENVRSAR